MLLAGSAQRIAEFSAALPADAAWAISGMPALFERTRRTEHPAPLVGSGFIGDVLVGHIDDVEHAGVVLGGEVYDADDVAFEDDWHLADVRWGAQRSSQGLMVHAVYDDLGGPFAPGVDPVGSLRVQLLEQALDRATDVRRFPGGAPARCLTPGGIALVGISALCHAGADAIDAVHLRLPTLNAIAADPADALRAMNSTIGTLDTRDGVPDPVMMHALRGALDALADPNVRAIAVDEPQLFDRFSMQVAQTVVQRVQRTLGIIAGRGTDGPARGIG